MELIGIELPPAHKYLESYLRNFLKDNPDTEKNIFLIMRFKGEPPFRRIVEIIRQSCLERGLKVLRADEKEYTDDLWDNVLTYMYGCDSAIAVFDQINARDFNPNVALEAGFFYARCKPVLLLKDIAIPAMPSDIAGRIYRGFNTYDPEGTLAPQVEKWLHDYAIGETPRP